SYEIVMDDLRDYRFYEADLFHPNKLATDYIWEKFSESILSENCKTTMNEVAKIVTARNHKVRNKFSEQHQEFLKIQIDKIKTLEEKYPYLNLTDDKNYFTSQLIK
ncbi:MAG: GSCFA domain-containing protein, partial [Melioribacteraceae bacterium]|nr:GSCFA domain-containing protein [Melioribacteraceae bacterium]